MNFGGFLRNLGFRVAEEAPLRQKDPPLLAGMPRLAPPPPVPVAVTVAEPPPPPPQDDAPFQPDFVLPPPEELVTHFESLGDNCEFGFVQRYSGVEPLGLFRFSFAHLPDLLAALRNGFARIGEPDDVELIFSQSREHMVRLISGNFVHHTFVFEGEADPEKLQGEQVKIAAFLKRKLIADLKSGEKIFVRKGTDTTTLAQATELFEALRQYGPVTLLWVVLADADHKAGTVELIRDGLMKGYFETFGPYDDAPNVYLEPWLALCREAYARRSGIGAAQRRKMHADATAQQIDHCAQPESFGGWSGSKTASMSIVWNLPHLRPGKLVAEHFLHADTTPPTAAIFGRRMESGLEPDEVYVGSCWVRIPAAFKGSVVGMVLNGYRSTRVLNAKLDRRDIWQQIWVSARIPRDLRGANLCLYVLGEAGSTIASTCWRLEKGVVPTLLPE